MYQSQPIVKELLELKVLLGTTQQTSSLPCDRSLGNGME